jgi:hypothetical protein
MAKGDKTMTHDEIDTMWSIATSKSIENNQMYTRYEFAAMVRQAVCKELSEKIACMPFGDTAASFAVWIREQK